MEVYTIGFGRHSAEAFFGALRGAGIERLIDVRLNNVSQLAGFTKRDDLRYFLAELCSAEYRHDLRLAPTDELLTAYRSKRLTWDAYAASFEQLLRKRHVELDYGPADFMVPTVLLCSEPTADRCHRRLVVDYLRATSVPQLVPVHL